MIGAIIGDIVGSKYEFNNIKTKDFPLFSEGCGYTDDSIMTVAVANALTVGTLAGIDIKEAVIGEMQRLGQLFPCPQGSYGMRFSRWLRSVHPQPYNSFGNGSAMRVSACGYAADDLGEALYLAKATAEVTHDHPEGIKGAQAVAAAIFLARNGKSKEEIGKYITDNFYALDKTLDEIRPTYRFNESCQGTVPEAIQAFLESTSFEDALRCAVSLGGDCDTLTAITGSIAWAYYVPQWPCADGDKIPKREKEIMDTAMSYLPEELYNSVTEFVNMSL